jgi:hypothetical protein
LTRTLEYCTRGRACDGARATCDTDGARLPTPAGAEADAETRPNNPNAATTTETTIARSADRATLKRSM